MTKQRLCLAAGLGSTACKFAEKVWNAQEAGAQAVSAFLPIGWLLCLIAHCNILLRCTVLNECLSLQPETEMQVIVVNYEDSHTTMEAPDEDDESSYM